MLGTCSISLLVRDYDEATSFYTNFNLFEDTDLGGGKCWVLIAPPGSAETCLLLAKAASPARNLALETRRADTYFFSCIQMISGATIRI
jgi:hypothetical protein